MIRQIVVDSICPLNSELIEKYKIRQVPLRIMADGVEYLDDAKLNKKSLLEKIEEGAHATTAAPSPMSFFMAGKEADECFIVCSSAKLSGSYNAALLAGRFLEDQNVRVHVFDSQSAGPAETAAAVFIGEKIEEGLSFEEIIQATEDRIESLNNYAFLSHLDNAVKSGRMPKIAGNILSTLSFVVVLTNENGRLKLKKLTRHIKKTINALKETTIEGAQRLGRSQLFLSHVAAEKIIQPYLESMKASGLFSQIFVMEESGVMTTYAGREAFLFTF